MLLLHVSVYKSSMCYQWHGLQQQTARNLPSKTPFKFVPKIISNVGFLGNGQWCRGFMQSVYWTSPWERCLYRSEEVDLGRGHVKLWSFQQRPQSNMWPPWKLGISETILFGWRLHCPTLNNGEDKWTEDQKQKVWMTL